MIFADYYTVIPHLMRYPLKL